MKEPYKKLKYKKSKYEVTIEVEPFSEEEQALMLELTRVEFEGMEYKMDIKRDGSMHRYHLDRKTARLMEKLELYMDN